jgi:putative transposase
MRFIDQLGLSRKLPRAVVRNNGPEMTSTARLCSSGARILVVKLNFIQPGKPAWNAFIESFNVRFRDIRPKTALV